MYGNKKWLITIFFIAKQFSAMISQLYTILVIFSTVILHILPKYKTGNHFVLNNCIPYRVLSFIFWLLHNYAIYKNTVISKSKLLIQNILQVSAQHRTRTS